MANSGFFAAASRASEVHFTPKIEPFLVATELLTEEQLISIYLRSVRSHKTRTTSSHKFNSHRVATVLFESLTNLRLNLVSLISALPPNNKHRTKHTMFNHTKILSLLLLVLSATTANAVSYGTCNSTSFFCPSVCDGGAYISDCFSCDGYMSSDSDHNICFDRRLFQSHNTDPTDHDNHYHFLWNDLVGAFVWFLTAGIGKFSAQNKMIAFSSTHLTHEPHSLR